MLQTVELMMLRRVGADGEQKLQMSYVMQQVRGTEDDYGLKPSSVMFQ